MPNQSTANSPVAILQVTTDPNSYASFQNGASSYAYFSPSIEGNFANGPAASVIELYRLVPATGADICAAGQLLGTFTLDASGTLAFVPQSFATLRLESATYAVGEVGGQVSVKVLRGGNVTGAVTATFSATNNSALLGTDYSNPSTATVSFASGDTEKTVAIPISNRTGYQGDRGFDITLSDPSTGATLVAHSAAAVSIIESEPPPPGEIAFNAATYQFSALNGSGNPNSLAITLSRSNGSAGAVSADVSVTGGTLVSGTHFNTFTNPTVVTFADGQTSRTVNIQLQTIASAQLPGTIVLGVANATGGASIGAQATATINVVSAGTVAFSVAAYQGSESNGSDTLVTITVTRSGGQNGAVSVNVAATGGTAGSGADYTLPASPVTLNWADGEGGARTFDITIKSDSAAEGSETVQLALQSATGGLSIGSPGAATLTILDADATAPQVTLVTPKANAKFTAASVVFNGIATDNQGVARVEVSLNGGAPQTATPTGATNSFNWSLTLTPEQGRNTAAVTAFDLQGNASATVERTFTFTNLRPQLAGSYNGLVVADPANGTPLDHHGLIGVNVTPTGKFTGKVTLRGVTLNITGVFLTGGEARFGRTLTPVFDLGSLGQLSLLLDTGAGEKITGVVKAGALTRASIPHADRAPFTPQAKTRYTAVFQADANAGLATTTFPQGDGFGTITVNPKGIAKIVGKLADGSAISYSNALSSVGEWPVFIALYAKQGFVTGPITFDAAQPNTDAAGADLKWCKPGGLANQKLYPGGWQGGITTDFVASKYDVPASPETSLGIVGATSANIVIAASDGGLTAASADEAILGANNKITVVGPGAGATGAEGLKVSLVKGTGAFNGSFVHPGSGKSVKFAGVAFQKTNTASGYFLFFPSSSAVPGTPAESGAVGIAPK